MKNNVFYSQKAGAKSRREVLKNRVLSRFGVALREERFEVCGSLVQEAKDLGVQQSEISSVIAVYLSGLNAGPPYEAGQKQENRPRFKPRF